MHTAHCALRTTHCAGSPMDSYEGLAYTLFISVAVVTNSKKEQNDIHEVQKGGKQKEKKKSL